MQSKALSAYHLFTRLVELSNTQINLVVLVRIYVLLTLSRITYFGPISHNHCAKAYDLRLFFAVRGFEIGDKHELASFFHRTHWRLIIKLLIMDFPKKGFTKCFRLIGLCNEFAFSRNVAAQSESES